MMIAKANGELEALQKQKENDLKSMQDEFQRKADEYQKGASTSGAAAWSCLVRSFRRVILSV